MCAAAKLLQHVHMQLVRICMKALLILSSCLKAAGYQPAAATVAGSAT
jgi:hypothetical protein